MFALFLYEHKRISLSKACEKGIISDLQIVLRELSDAGFRFLIR